jgi:Preprotein translocase subunit SecY
LLSWLANAWRVPELRRRLLFTAGILAAYRLGSWMPAPGVDSAQIQNFFNGRGGSLLGLLNLFSGSALSRFSIFALGIMPYVTASIILQLLTVVIPQLEQLQKEGEAGYAKINQYTRYLTVALAAAQATGYAYLFHTQGALPANPGRLVLIVVTLTRARAADVVRRADHEARHRQRHLASDLRVDPDLHAAGINAWLNGGAVEKLFFPLIAIGIVVAVVFVQEGQRRIPIQYAKRMVGRRQTQGGATYMPLRVNMAGVIPVIFAAALLALPQTVSSFAPSRRRGSTRTSRPRRGRTSVEDGADHHLHLLLHGGQFNPVDQADNLRKYGGYIPGIRPGPPTAQYLDRVLTG